MNRRRKTASGGAQLGFHVKPPSGTNLMIGGGYYDYQQVKNFSGVYDEEDFFGNSHYDDDGTDLYQWDYNLFEVLGEFGVKMEKLSISVYGNFVTNTDPDSLNTGWLIGGRMSRGKGLEAGLSYGVADKAALALTYFLNRKGIEEEVDFKRLQADLQVKF